MKKSILHVLFQNVLLFNIILFLFLNVMAQDQSQEAEFPDVKWIEGPCVANIGGIAEINVPEGFIFCDGDNTRILMESMGNLPTHEEVGFLAGESFDWFIVFEFSRIGYIRDDEKDTLDHDAMLKSIQKGTEQANKYRKKRGFPNLYITGWEIEPHYNLATNNLEWAIRGKDEYESPFINYNTRLLGRSGVMRVTLVAEPEEIESTIPVYKMNLESFAFKPGNRYAEFRKGDKVAKYGLTALVVGGGAALVAKTGLGKYIWKILIAIFIGISALFKRISNFFKQLFRKNY
jgi:uncharacterized membrane-anchored protein